MMRGRLDGRTDGWSDECGDDDYDSKSDEDEYGYDYNDYNDGHHDDKIITRRQLW